ncbi:DUF2922 domain-containing protein [Enterococcus sp.]|uniref:DUF2922 domain-containing protein n=1 Tax=Enterococcus sp. TaxID=35783 RepID=UPI002911CE51|nr:DUF2922 domain-containing protein [Enterococcus sp.]MDU5333267.1 DUF2922 domain-containing protein [Enterococcus sp.]
MQKLVAVFENSKGKNHRWTFKDPDPNKSAEEIRTALEKLTALNLFEKDGVRLYQKVVSAKIIETTEKTLFDINEEKTAVVEESVQNHKSNLQTAEENGFTIQIAEEPEDGIKQMEVVLPKGRDISSVSDEELKEMVVEVLPDDAILEDLYYEEVSDSSEIQQLEESVADSKRSSPEKSENIPKDASQQKETKTTQKKKINKTKRKLLERFKQHKKH